MKEALSILAFASFGSRKSGLYIALLATLIFLWLLFQAYRRKSLPSYLLLTGIFLFTILSAAGYWANLYIYGNPIFPFKAPWPFHKGEFIHDRQHKVPDPETMPGLVEALRLYATGTNSYSEVADFLNSKGFRTSKGRPFTEYNIRDR